MADTERGPSVDEIQHILENLRRALDQDALPHEEYLQIEMTLRGMLPDLEARLQQHLTTDGENPDAALEGMVTLSADLMWIQLHAREPAETLKQRLQEALAAAQRVVAYLSN